MMIECKVEVCRKIDHHGSHGYCGKHSYQFKKYGKIFLRTDKSPNEIRLKETHAEILLYNKKCEVIGFAMIDCEDIDKVAAFKWSLRTDGYVQTTIYNVKKNASLRLSRLILNAGKGQIVDHIDRNPLNNCKSNLRIVTAQQSSSNRAVVMYGGIYYRRDRNKWNVSVQKSNKRYWVGAFKTKEEAVNAKISACLKYFGDYSPVEIRGVS